MFYSKYFDYLFSGPYFLRIPPSVCLWRMTPNYILPLAQINTMAVIYLPDQNFIVKIIGTHENPSAPRRYLENS